MIEHKITFIEHDFDYEWLLELPFRLNYEDRISMEFIEEKGLLRVNGEYKNQCNDYPDKWYDLSRISDEFTVYFIKIDHNGLLEVDLTLE